ncbi:MAG: hypothetical protein R3E79_30540 [Caldilineaceae bacterium]
MLLKNPFKLQKLQINVYGNRRRIGLPQATFTVMFNPATFTMHHENKFEPYQGINTSSRRARYSYSPANAPNSIWSSTERASPIWESRRCWAKGRKASPSRSTNFCNYVC